VGSFCQGDAPYISFVGLWSNAQSVFAAVESEVYRNSGSGWTQMLSNSSVSFGSFSGFPEGPLVLTASVGSRCGILFLDEDVLSCAGAAQNVAGVFPLAPTLAYAVVEDRLLLYQGEFWTQVGEPLGDAGLYGTKLWADAQQATVFGGLGRVFRYELESDSWKALPSFPADRSPLAAWGFGPQDLWLSTGPELLHFDGATWQQPFTQQGECGNIRGMWGQAGVLFFYTASSVFRLGEGKFEPILRLPCDDAGAVSIRGLWGNSPSEVFIAIQNYQHAERALPCGQLEPVLKPADACGAIRLLFYDGVRVGAL
jgi:hypothetical protein